jgi:hypothetical protein
MGQVYRPGEDLEPGDRPPAGLAIGDAWFWHADQTLLHALVNHPRIAPEHASVRLLGFNGARLNQYIGDGAYAGIIRMHLTSGLHAGCRAFYLSGFLNDALEHRLGLRDDCTSALTPAACFAPERLDLLLFHVAEGLGGIIRAIRWVWRKSPAQQPIFLNGYDYPVPDGRGFLDAHGGWITTLMDEAGVDPDLGFRTDVMKLLIDAVNDDVLAPCHAPHEQVFHVDGRGTLAMDPAHYRDDWENELYPTDAGFTKILERAWFPRLKPFGIVV